MAKAAEKLIILGDIGQGLLTRLHFLQTFKKPAFFTENDKFTKALVKSFPDFPEKLNKIPGAELFAKQAAEITTGLSDYYLTFLDVLNFREEAWKLLLDLSKTIVEFKFDLNLDLMEYFLNLMLRFVKVHIMVAEFDEGFLLTAYAKAFHMTSGNTEPNYNRLTKFVIDFKEPIRRLQEECTDIGLCVGDTLMSFMQPIYKWSQLKTYLDSRVFNILDEPRQLGLPTGEGAHSELLHLEKFRQWVMWGFLICPAELQREGAFEYLKVVLKDYYVVPVFREKVINMHDEFDTLFSWYKKDKFKLAKSKKLLKDSSSPQEMCDAHANYRTYLRLEMNTLHCFFTDHVGCIPPKLQLILSIMNLARDEVLWYVRHQQILNNQESKKKKVLVDDPQISSLLYLVVRLGDLVLANTKAIQEYYLEFLNGPDAELIKPVADQFLSNAPASANTTQLLQNILKDLADPKIADNFEAIRLNWYRVSAAINHQSSGIQQKMTQQLSQAMNNILMHSRNVDCLETQVKNCGSFMALYFYRDELFTMLTEVLKATNGTAAHALAFVRVLNDSLHNVHRICPEEQPIIGKMAVTKADDFLRTIVIGVERLVKFIVAKTTALRQQTGPSEVVKRIDKKQQALPGYESLFANRAIIEQLRQARKGVADLCQSLHAFDAVVTYNIEFVPREYLYESMAFNIRTTLRTLCIKGKSVERPSRILKNFLDVIYSYQSVEKHLNMNLSEIVRDVLLSEMSDDALPGAGMPFVTEAKSDDEKAPKSTSIIQTIANMYLAVFSWDLGEYGISYSSIKKSFVSRAIAKDKGAAPTVYLNAEKYTDFIELRALCRLIGPYGLRVLDKKLLSVVEMNVKIIKDVIAENQQHLNAIQGHFTERAFWSETVAKLAKTDALCKHSIIIGCILLFRKMLREAMQHVTRSKIPFIHETVRLAFTHLHEDGEVDLDMQNLDYLAADLGIDVNEADHSLRAALKKFKTQSTDIALWGLLPEMYGLAYESNRWKSSEYSIAQEGHINNENCMVSCIASLMVGFQRIPLSVEKSQETNRRIQLDFERFIKISSYSILHMNSKVAEFPTPSVMIFLEQFILGSGGRLSLSLLEECFPFTMLRTNYIQLYEKQTQSYVVTQQASAEDDKE